MEESFLINLCGYFFQHTISSKKDKAEIKIIFSQRILFYIYKKFFIILFF